jgi:hypothetical protein
MKKPWKDPRQKKAVGDFKVCPRRMALGKGYRRGGQTPIKKPKKPPRRKLTILKV